MSGGERLPVSLQSEGMKRTGAFKGIGSGSAERDFASLNDKFSNQQAFGRQQASLSDRGRVG